MEQNRENVNGVVLQTTNPSVPLTDFIFQTGIATTSLQQRHIRLEARSDFTKCGAPEFQIGRVDNATLHVGVNFADTPGPFAVGLQATASTMPTKTLTINGILACSGRMIRKMCFALVGYMQMELWHSRARAVFLTSHVRYQIMYIK